MARLPAFIPGLNSEEMLQHLPHQTSFNNTIEEVRAATINEEDALAYAESTNTTLATSMLCGHNEEWPGWSDFYAPQNPNVSVPQRLDDFSMDLYDQVAVLPTLENDLLTLQSSPLFFNLDVDQRENTYPRRYGTIEHWALMAEQEAYTMGHPPYASSTSSLAACTAFGSRSRISSEANSSSAQEVDWQTILANNQESTYSTRSTEETSSLHGHDHERPASATFDLQHNTHFDLPTTIGENRQTVLHHESERAVSQSECSHSIVKTNGHNMSKNIRVLKVSRAEDATQETQQLVEITINKPGTKFIGADAKRRPRKSSLPSLKSLTKLPGSTNDMADIRLLANVEISVEEILTFFPRHYTWQGLLVRLVRNGWTQYDIVAYINWSRDAIGIFAVDYNTLTKDIAPAEVAAWGKKFGNKKRPRDDPEESRRPRADWKLARGRPFNISLTLLANGVVHWPEDTGIGQLTHCVRYALDHPERDLRLSDVDELIRELEPPGLAPNPEHSTLDAHAKIRLRPILEDRKWKTPKVWARDEGLWDTQVEEWRRNYPDADISSGRDVDDA